MKKTYIYVGGALERMSLLERLRCVHEKSGLEWEKGERDN